MKFNGKIQLVALLSQLTLLAILVTESEPPRLGCLLLRGEQYSNHTNITHKDYLDKYSVATSLISGPRPSIVWPDYILTNVTDLPAAWTTRPRVVVILEEVALADSKSKPEKNE